MSLACGTLAHPYSEIKKGNKLASSSNGKQHTLPSKFHHGHMKHEQIAEIWDAKASKQPTRLWGTVTNTRFGGEQRPESEAHTWTNGELWNIDSNIKKWGEHEIRRNASSASHDVHRHDQIQRVVLPPQAGAKKSMGSRLCVSGVVSPDSCFLEAWGFDLGLRDRQAKPVGLWRPVGKAEHFRHPRSYDRNIPRILDYHRSMKLSSSAPTFSDGLTTTLRPEDVGGEAGDHQAWNPKTSVEEKLGQSLVNMEKAGRMHGSRSCPYHEGYDHTVKREGARMSCSIHSPAFKQHIDGHPFIQEIELRPQAIYTLKYRKAEKEQPGSGQKALRKREAKGKNVQSGL